MSKALNVLLYLILISSCNKKNNVAPNASEKLENLKAINSNTVLLNNLLLETTFENQQSLDFWGKEIYNNNSLRLVNTIVRAGKYSARFELNKTEPKVFGGKRAEISQLSDYENEKWYGFSNYIPKEFLPDPAEESVAQWHEIPDFSLGENWLSSPLSLCILKDRWVVEIRWDSKAVTTKTSFNFLRIDLGPVTHDKWNDWVFRIKWAYDKRGILQVWENGKLVINRVNLPNSFNDKKYPYFKIGIYKWPWSDNKIKSTTTKRVLYFDEVRIGNKNSNYDEVVPK